MKALLFREELEIVCDYPDPKPKEGEALIKVLMSGICNTDIEITKGYMDYHGILGHEFVGRVEDVKGENKDLIGQRVVGEINCGCGDCQYCGMDLPRHCGQREVLGISQRDGCFAEYITLPAENLHPVSDALSDEEAAFCEPMAAALEVMEQVHIRPDDHILVLGDGKLGLLIVHALQQTAARITLAGRHLGKLKIASDWGVRTRLVSELKDELYDVVVEATGAEKGFETSLQHVRPRGTVVLKSTLAACTLIDTTAIVVNELTLVGSRCGPFAPALRSLEHMVDFKPLISAIYPFDQALEAFARADRSDALKVLLDMQK